MAEEILTDFMDGIKLKSAAITHLFILNKYKSRRDLHDNASFLIPNYPDCSLSQQPIDPGKDFKCTPNKT